MISAAAAVLSSFVVMLLATPLVRALVLRGVVDRPGGRRVHENVTPRLGGVAVMAGFFAPLALFTLCPDHGHEAVPRTGDLVAGLLLGSAVVGGVGAADDARGHGPWKKLAAQAVAAVVAYG